jgi:hypothetical protein
MLCARMIDKYQQLLEWLIPDADDCRRAAADLRVAHPDWPAEQVARQAVRGARKWAASVGAATGIAANPLTMLPAALADAAAMLRIEGRLAGTIAALIDPASLDDRERFRRDILRVIFPGAVSQVLRKMGMSAGERATKAAVQRLAERVASKELTERATKMLGIRLTEKAVATKTVPIVGAAIGAGWNWVEVQAVGRRAIEYHVTGELPEGRVARQVRHAAAKAKEQVRKARAGRRESG